jgi:hypothetical protein
VSYHRLRGPAGKKEYISTEDAAEFLGVSQEFFEDTIAPSEADWFRPIFFNRMKRWSTESLAVLRFILNARRSLREEGVPQPPDDKKK